MKNFKLYQRTVSLLMAGGFTLMVFNACTAKKSNLPEESTTLPQIEMEGIGLVNAGYFGLKLGNKAKKSNYEVLSGNIDSSKITRSSDGTLYVDSDALEKSSQVGKVVIDDKDGKLEVKTDPITGETRVYDTIPGYQIIDEDGNVKETGDETPEGYHKIEGSKDLLKDGYVVAPHDYYGNDGSIIIAKGDVISEETKKRADKELYSSKSDIPTTEVSTEEIVTYSNDELVKRLMEQGVSFEDAYLVIYGEPYTESYSNNNQNETTVAESTTVIETTTVETTTQTSNSGYYTDPDSGLLFESKADCDQWKLNGYEGYSLVNGIMVANNKNMEAAKQKSLGGN